MSDTLDTIIEMVEAALGAGDEEQVKVLLKSAYQTFVGKYRPLLSAGADLMDELVKDASTLAVPLWSSILAVDGSEEMHRLRVLRAGTRYRCLQHYVDAGFTREEAMALVLRDMGNVKTTTADAVQKAGDSWSKKS